MNVLSDLSGVSGMKILGAILEGERDPWELAALVKSGVKARKTSPRALRGRQELVFVLRQLVELYRIYQKKINDCDLQLRKHLQSLGPKVDLKTQPMGPRPQGKKKSRNAPRFDLRTKLYRITGIDWLQINGIGVLTAHTVIAEAGTDGDLSAFPTEQQFTSWLGLVPTNDQSGGKILNRRTRKVVNRATVAFRNAAVTLPPLTYPSGRSQSHHRHGSEVTLAHQTRTQYVDKGTEYYEARYREQQIRSLLKRAQKLGFQLVTTKAG